MSCSPVSVMYSNFVLRSLAFYMAVPWCHHALPCRAFYVTFWRNTASFLLLALWTRVVMA